MAVSSGYPAKSRASAAVIQHGRRGWRELGDFDMTVGGRGCAVSTIHYHYMDGLRAGFMFTGVFVHAALLGTDPVFDGIVYLSSLFRMEGFFVISGYLS